MPFKETLEKINLWLPIPNAMGTVVVAVFAFLAYYNSIQESDLKIKFSQKQVQKIAPLTLPNSQKIYDINPAYAFPSTTILNEVVISNTSSNQASNVTVRLQIEKGPFIFILISFDKESNPAGTWTIIPDTESYKLITVKLDLVTKTKPAKFFLVFSFPKSFDLKGKTIEPKALYVVAHTASQKKPIEGRYNLEYWK